MQIDFHHGVVYVIARLADFSHAQAEVIAYCSQYVDDAVNSGTIKFDNGAMYSRISSAHKALDYRNFSELENQHVWLPFHFLPGNGGQPEEQNPDGSFIQKIICRPASPVARQMLEACIADRNERYGLHRLGVTMHVFADTWSHQRFAGVCHKANSITMLDENNKPNASFLDRIKKYFGDAFDRTANHFISDVFPLGHGAALSHPDKPFLAWQYKDNDGNTIRRSNTDIFAAAAHELCKAMQRFRAGSASADVPGLRAADRDKIGRWMADVQDCEGPDRHQKWLDLIGRGEFGFPAVKLQYRDKGPGSWKYRALGTERDVDLKDEVFTYTPAFLTSDWKLFHDALIAHRFIVIHKILPRFGICAASQ
ncbi:MAG: hypothetical protein M0036_25500 [Desulfobacteraceae bacterium]|nr:hypothetical protein [Desulfobacteraceae bacterium]